MFRFIDVTHLLFVSLKETVFILVLPFWEFFIIWYTFLFNEAYFIFKIAEIYTLFQQLMPVRNNVPNSIISEYQKLQQSTDEIRL